MTLGTKMRALRKMLRLNQEELAYRLDTNRVSVSQWENDKVVPDTANIRKLAAVFGSSVAYLMGETDCPAPRAADEGADEAANSASGEDDEMERLMLGLFRRLDDSRKKDALSFLHYQLYITNHADDK